MELMRKYILSGIFLLPTMVMAATDCKVIEYPDHFDAVCIGDEKSAPAAVQASAAALAPAAAKAPKAAYTPVSAQTTLAAYAPAAAQVPLSAPVYTPVTAQTDSINVPVVTGQPLSDPAASDAASASKTRTNGKISFLTRLRDNQALRSNKPRY